MTDAIQTAKPAQGFFAMKSYKGLRPEWAILALLLCTTSACDRFIRDGKGTAVVAQDQGLFGSEKLSNIQTNPLSVTDAVRLGVLKSNGVAFAQIARAKSATEIQVAQSAYWPEAFIGVSPSSTSGNIAAASAGVRYTLFTFGARAAQLNATKANQKAAETEVINATNLSVSGVLDTYIDFSVNAAIAVAAKEYSKRIADLGVSIESRVNSGASSPADLNEIKVGALRAEAAQLNAEAASADSRVALMSVTGIGPQSVQSAQDLQNLLAIGTDQSRSAPDFESFPQILALNQSVLAAEYNLEAAKAGRFPELKLEASAGYEIAPSGSAAQSGTRFGPIISNVFGMGGGKAARLKGAMLDVNAARTHRAEEMRRLNEQFLLSQNDMIRATSAERKRKAIYMEVAKMLEVYIAEYQVGSRQLSDVVSVQERLFQSRVDDLNAQRELLRAKKKYLMATNALANRVYQPPI